MESEVILTTERLRLRKLTPDDLPLLEKSLCDARVMYAYEHGFSRDEALEWLERQITRYSSDGCGLWGVERLSDGAFLGQCGITMQPLYDTLVQEIGYVSTTNTGASATRRKQRKRAKSTASRSWAPRNSSRSSAGTTCPRSKSPSATA